MSEPILMQGYRALTTLARPLLPLWLNRRIRQGKELPDRVGERFGRASQARPPGAVIWCHAASVGEAKSVTPLLDALPQSVAVVVTTGTVTSARQLAGYASHRLIHQFAPLDNSAYVGRFLDHWRPSLALRVESEIWPTTLIELKRRHVPAIVVNGRMSARSASRWKRHSAFSTFVFGALDLALTQSDGDREVFSALGSRKVIVTGNLKASAPVLADVPDLRGELARAIGNRPRWIAASIHPGEDEIAMRCHKALRARFSGLLTVVAPRHPDEAERMARIGNGMGLNVARRTLGQRIAPETDIFISDTFGELGALYRLCPIVFVGKSLAVGGGQNPIEPAQLGCALLMGPAMSNFQTEAAALLKSGGAETVAGEAELSAALSRLLSDVGIRTAMGARAASAAAPDRKPLEDTLAALRPYFSRCGID